MIISETKILKLNSARGRLHIFWAFILFSFLLFPFLTDSGNTGILSCRFHQLTGLSCPTCGMSRSIFELTRFHLLESFKMHLFGPVVYIIALLLFLKLSFEVISGTIIKIGLSSRTLKRTFLSIGIMWILYWLVRMLFEIIHT